MQAPSTAGSAAVARGIGPNAITRVAEVLAARCGAGAAERVFGAAGLLRHLRQPPTQLVDEREVRRLHVALRSQLGLDEAAAVARQAGEATAGYLLARRIPRPLQWLLRVLPARAAAAVLLAAVGRNAWTFVGSGSLRTWRDAGCGAWTVEIHDNPLCRSVRAERPLCDFYVATFERLFRALVHAHCRVQEVSCEARGDDACRLRITPG
jgi:divinyl protochlorophyllide a 8-vinyl-reductase